MFHPFYKIWLKLDSKFLGAGGRRTESDCVLSEVVSPSGNQKGCRHALCHTGYFMDTLQPHL